MEKSVTLVVVARPGFREGLLELAGKQRLPGRSFSSLAPAAG